MVYLDNITNTQRVYIPRPEIDNTIPPGIILQSKDYHITESGITAITPDIGFDGISAGTINVDINEEEWFNSGYTSGYTDGYATGYTSGSTDGFASGYTEGYSSGETEGYGSGYTDGYATGYTSGSTDGYVSGYTSGTTEGFASGYTSGYTVGYSSGETDGYNTGYASGETDGMAEQKALLSSTAFTQNGEYESENGWSSVTVNTPTVVVNQDKSMVLTANDTISLYFNPIEITPDSGYTGIGKFSLSTNVRCQNSVFAGKFTQNGIKSVTVADVFPNDYFKEFQIEIDVDQEGPYYSGYTEGYADGYASGETDGYSSGYTEGYSSGCTEGYASGTTDGYSSGYTEGYSSGYTEGYASGNTDGYASGYTSGSTDGYTSGVTEQKGLLESTAFTANGTYTKNDGWSSVTVSVDYKTFVITATTTASSQTVTLYQGGNVTRVYVNETSEWITSSAVTFETPGTYVLDYYTSDEYPHTALSSDAFVSAHILAQNIGIQFLTSCVNIASITFGSTINGYLPHSFAADMFSSSALKSITLPDGILDIGSRAFENDDLHSVVMESSFIDTIGFKAFYANHNLSSITCYSTVAPKLCSQVFEQVASTGTVYVPSGSITSYTTNWLPELPSGWTIAPIS